MSDAMFINYFGNAADFEQLKKWFRQNSDIYKELINAAKERCDLETEYSMKLSKIGNKIFKTFSQTMGTVSDSWTKTAKLMVTEADYHKKYSSDLYEDFYKPLLSISEAFSKNRKPIEAEIDRCYKVYQDKHDEEIRLKKKAFVATKDSEKAFDAIQEYIKTHPTSIQGNDKDRAKIEKKAHQAKETSVTAEKDYFDSAMSAEESRHKWESIYLRGIEQLEKIETERLITMKTILDNYQRAIDKIPTDYAAMSQEIKNANKTINVNEDLVMNATFCTNKNPTKYQTEQVLLDLYSESKDNPMDKQRRIENLTKRMSVMYQTQKTYNDLRLGALKMISVYEDKPQFADETTKSKTKREYSRTQTFVNYLSTNIYKLMCVLHNFTGQKNPHNPLNSHGMVITKRNEKSGIIQSVAVSNPGVIMSPFDPGNLAQYNTADSHLKQPVASPPVALSYKPSSRSVNKTTSKVLDNIDVFDSDSDDGQLNPRHSVVESRTNPNQIYFNQSINSNYYSVSSSSTGGRGSSMNRPLPNIPMGPKCRAIHAFTGRDADELTFNQGDVMVIVEKVSEVWWTAELRGLKGLIPVSYVEEI